MTDTGPEMGGAAAGMSSAFVDGARQAFEANLATIRARIESAGTDPDGVRIIAVTKGFDTGAVLSARAAGVVDVGENYAQELLAKASGAPDPALRWHFIGPIQRNKVPALAPVVSLWHGIDRLSAGRAIARRRPGAEVLVQVNASGETSKHGCRPGEVAELVDALRGLDLQVSGLMTIAPQGPPDQARPVFAKVADLARELGLEELSMGMTDDLEVAVQEGATMVRVGRGLFGSRDAEGESGDGRLVNGGD